MPTALELSREEWQPYIEAARKRLVSPNLSLAEQERREQLLTRVREAARQLKFQFNVQRVILFGSLAGTDWFIPDSDVDLAVEGLTADNFWHAWRIVEDVIGDRPVDLVEIETASEALRNAIQKYGLEL
ncbi:MAG: nucleotidyltransferase domain-containing protein [Anaerolineaceae bacterium]|nr:nucleotidyltransferase domain-containing protein [Anaerolineaceae bacterium]